MTAPFGHYTAMTRIASEVGGPMPLAMLLIGGGMAGGAELPAPMARPWGRRAGKPS